MKKSTSIISTQHVKHAQKAHASHSSGTEHQDAAAFDTTIEISSNFSASAATAGEAAGKGSGEEGAGGGYAATRSFEASRLRAALAGE
mgnify:CR=1 FL=1